MKREQWHGRHESGVGWRGDTYTTITLPGSSDDRRASVFHAIRLYPAPDPGAFWLDGTGVISNCGRSSFRDGKACGVALGRIVIGQEMHHWPQCGSGGFEAIDFQGQLRQLDSLVTQNYAELC